jgi:hypothetical protein
MAELKQYASSNERHLVFDGKTLHKTAFQGKGKHTKAHAAVIASCLEASLTGVDADYLLSRMDRVKKGFKGKVEHYIQNMFVANTKKFMMKTSAGLSVTNFDDLLKELECNPKMESFQNWYNVFYREMDMNGVGKKNIESELMKECNLMYHDGTVEGGCVGELVSVQISKEQEKIQSRSRSKQRLHLVKSYPGKDRKQNRRATGEYYIIHSAADGSIFGFEKYNVSYAEYN